MIIIRYHNYKILSRGLCILKLPYLVMAIHAETCCSKYQITKTSSCDEVSICYQSFISIQPQRQGWQEPEPGHVIGMALTHCILGKILGVVCHCFPPPLDVPTFTARCLYVPQRRERS